MQFMPSFSKYFLSIYYVQGAVARHLKYFISIFHIGVSSGPRKIISRTHQVLLETEVPPQALPQLQAGAVRVGLRGMHQV